MERPDSDRKENHLEESSILDKDINHHENGEVDDNMSIHSINHSQLLTQDGKFLSCYYNHEETETSDESIVNLSTTVQEHINQSWEV